MKIAYRDGGARGLYVKTRRLIHEADEILSSYWRDGEGFALTLRQLFYQFVARGRLANKPSEYERLGRTMTDARYLGLIDWDMLIDRTREIFDWTYVRDERDALLESAATLKFDKWASQPSRVELWIEKDAAIGVIEAVSTELEVPYMSSRGYHSTSGAWQAAQRLRRHILAGQSVLALHIADHDPSGVDMTRDLQDRLTEFLQHDVAQAYGRKYILAPEDVRFAWSDLWLDGKFEVRRIALNMDQVEAFRPPGQPVKRGDTRTPAYVEQFGEMCWELDALEPDYVADLIRGHVLGERDQAEWAMRQGWEQEARAKLKVAADSWDDVAELLDPAPTW